MNTHCGCPPGAGLDGPQYPLHSLETCRGRWVPLWSCETTEGIVAVYETCVVAFAHDESAANALAMWPLALTAARKEWVERCTAASHHAMGAIETARDADRVNRRGSMFIAWLEEVPVYLNPLVSSYQRLVKEKGARV